MKFGTPFFRVNIGILCFFEGKTSNTYPDQVERCLAERRSWCKYSDPHPSRVEGYFPLLSKKVCSVNVTVFTIIYIIVKI